MELLFYLEDHILNMLLFLKVMLWDFHKI